jgi:hypothetical protein
MVDFYVPEQQFDKNAFDSYFDISKAGTLDVLGATLDETLYYNPLSALNRTFDQYAGPGADGRRLSAEEHRESQYYRPGIEVDEDGMTEGLANLLAERYDRRAAFRSTLNRSRGGFGLGAAQFGTMLAGSVIDPFNIASAFIPTIGAARMATMAAKYGKTGSRLIGGAINGAVGAVPLEAAIILPQAYRDQDPDYGLMDSFLNVTFGAVLGGGLHAGFGKISDRIEASAVKREALARSIVDALNDQPISGHKIIEAEEAAKDAEIIAAANERLAKDRSVRGVEPRFDPKTGDIVEETVFRGDQVPEFGEPPIRKGKARPPRLRVEEPKTLIQYIRAKGGIDPNSQGAADLKEVIPAAKSGKFYVSAAKGGRSVDEMLTAAREDGYLPAEIEGVADDIGINDLIDAVREDKAGNKQYSIADADAVREFESAQDIQDFLARKGIDPTGMTDGELDRAISEAEFVDQQLSIDAVDRDVEPSALEGSPLTQQESLNAQNEALIQDYDLGVDIDGKPKLAELEESGMNLRVQEYQETIDEIAQLEEELTIARADSEDELPQDFIDDIESADAAIRRADEYMPEAVKRAAVCVFGKSGAAS